jgi:cysteine synthase
MWSPLQFENPLIFIKKRLLHKIIKSIPRRLGYLITGVETGGYKQAVPKYLKQHFPNLKGLCRPGSLL